MLRERSKGPIHPDAWSLWAERRQSFPNLSNCQLSLCRIVVYQTHVSVKLSGNAGRYRNTELINKQEGILRVTSALFAAIGEMHSWRRVWEWQELYFISGFKGGKGFQMIPQTIQIFKAVTQAQIEYIYTANLIDALRDVFCKKFLLFLEVIFKLTGTKSRKDITLYRCMSSRVEIFLYLQKFLYEYLLTSDNLGTIFEIYNQEKRGRNSISLFADLWGLQVHLSSKSLKIWLANKKKNWHFWSLCVLTKRNIFSK